MKRLTQGQVKEIHELCAANMSVRAIAEQLRHSLSTVSKYNAVWRQKEGLNEDDNQARDTGHRVA